jgi:hypothetical protein
MLFNFLLIISFNSVTITITRNITFIFVARRLRFKIVVHCFTQKSKIPYRKLVFYKNVNGKISCKSLAIIYYYRFSSLSKVFINLY